MKISWTKVLLLMAILPGSSSQAQLRVPITNNDLRINLQKIVSDFPNQFSTLRGDTLIENPQSIEFASRLEFSGATENSIIQYKSVRPVYSWQATLLSTEEFEEAEKKYRWLYNQLRVMTIKLDNGYSFSLNGDYDEASESKKFCGSIFKMTPNATDMPKLKIEASMQFEFPEWKVNLLVYEREKEDTDRADVIED
jgi:hypothetical protein